MNKQQWIVIPKWETFQHYRDRQPRWIKLYPRLLHDWAYLELTGHQRAVLHGLWMLYASTDRQVALNTTSLTRQLGLRVTSQQLEALRDAGFLRFSASKPLPLRQRQMSSASQKTETDSLPSENGENPLVTRLLSEISDSNSRTEQALRGFQRRLPDAAFAAALESLRHRRKETRRALTSEARYVVATLNTMARENQYRHS